MARSVRISDDLYSMALVEAALMHRSVAQQLEHWAAIGQALEARGDLPAVREASIAHQRARDHDRVRRGKLRARALHFIPKERVQKAELAFPRDAFAEFEPD
jgi:hypothetical protein